MIIMNNLKRVLIIGAGVTGCSIARNLSRYRLDIKVLEKEVDVAEGSTKANSGIVHAGYAAKHGTLKSRLCVIGNALYSRLDSELNFGFRRSGSLVLGFTDEDLEVLKELYANGLNNNVPDLEIIGRDKILSIDPGINPDVRYALYAPTAGVTSPYEFAIALAENSIENGAEFFFNSEVVSLSLAADNTYRVESSSGTYIADYVINAAGLYSDIISKAAGFDYFEIKPRKGQYLIFDRFSGTSLKSVLFQVPGKMGKGILVTSTFHENLMIGPDALDTGSREDIGTDYSSLKEITAKARISYPSIDISKIIRSFAGLRAVGNRGDFIIEAPGNSRNFINVSGIESPGLTSSPAIALMVEDILREQGMELLLKDDFNPYRPAVIKRRESLPPEEVERRIKLLSSPEKLICRCEQVSEGVIRDSLERGIKVISTDGVKRRTRAGMGRCQGAFCRNRVKSLVSEVYNIPADNVLEPEREKENILSLKKYLSSEEGGI